jgi:hypothetical protein
MHTHTHTHIHTDRERDRERERERERERDGMRWDQRGLRDCVFCFLYCAEASSSHISIKGFLAELCTERWGVI